LIFLKFDFSLTEEKNGSSQYAIYTMRGGLWRLKVSVLAKFVSGGLGSVVVKPARCI